MSGSLQQDRFSILRRLGEGGMGVVYEALDREQGLKVALKQLGAQSTACLLQLKAEFRALRDVHHENLARLGELVESQGQWFFTMELVDGPPLLAYLRPGAAPVGARTTGLERNEEAVAMEPTKELIVSYAEGTRGAGPMRLAPATKRPREFDEVRLRSVLGQLVRGLHTLHAAGKVHRDIKPQNLLVTPCGRLVISDFGLVTERVLHASSVAVPKSIAGTPAFIAPERLSSDAEMPESDWFSVGVVLYEALVGMQPFQGTLVQMQDQKVSGLVVRPGELVEGVPEDLDQLCVALLKPKPDQRPTGAQLLARFGGATPEHSLASEMEPFVGREEELQTLMAAYDKSRRGPGGLWILQGESGVGKSTLSRRFAARVLAKDPEACVLFSRCHERESVPYKAFDGVMDELTRVLRKLPDDALAQLLPRGVQALSQLFPVFSQVPAKESARVPDAADATERRSLLFQTLRTLLERVAQRCPLVMVLDDLQWADTDSFRLLQEVLRCPTPSLLVLATVRVSTPLQTRWWPPDGRELWGENVHHMQLRALPKDAARELVRQLTACQPHALGKAAKAATLAELSATIADSSGGHPLFIRELVLHARGRSDWYGEAVGLEEALMARIEQLPSEARELLTLICLADAPIPNEALRDAAAMSPVVFAETQAKLQHERLTRVSGLRRVDAAEPYHDRIRQAVLSRPSPAQLQDCHRRLAEVLTRSQSADAEQVALHWQGAGEPNKAYAFALRAAEEADAALAFERAARLYRTCLTLAPPTPLEIRNELLLKLAHATARAGKSADAAAIYLDAAAVHQGVAATNLRRLAAGKLLYSGYFEAGRELMKDLLKEAGYRLPTSAWSAFFLMLWERARLKLQGLTPKHLDSPKTDPALLFKADLLGATSMALGLIEPIVSAAYSARALRFVLNLGDRTRLVRALTAEYAFQSAMGGETPAVQRIFRLATSLTRDDPELVSQCNGVRSMALFIRGEDYPKALALGLEAERDLVKAKGKGYADPLESFRTFTNLLLFYTGDWRQLAERIRTQFPLASHRGDILAVSGFISTHATVGWLMRDAADQVESILNETMVLWPRDSYLVVHFWALLARVQIDLYRGDAASALARLRAEEKRLRRSLLLRYPIVHFMVKDAHARVLSRLATSATGPERKRWVSAFRRVTRGMGRTGVSFAAVAQASCEATLAQLQGNVAHAVATVQAAADGYDRAGMALHAVGCRYRAAEWRVGHAEQGAAPELDALLQPFRAQGVHHPLKMLPLLVP